MDDDSVSVERGYREYGVVGDAGICGKGTVPGVCGGAPRLFLVTAEGSGGGGFGDVGAQLDRDAFAGGGDRGEGVVAAVDGADRTHDGA